MALSKRLRYEILRRDNHQCRYCGGVAPDVVLTVDHVVPVTLGGADEPSNLVAACRDCNSGKSASPADAALVESVSDDAVRWAAAMKQAAAHERALLEKQHDACDEVAVAWKPRYLPAGWENSVYSLLAAGLELHDLLELVEVAKWARGVDDRWRYFCGCCWKRLRQIQDRAREIVESAPEGIEKAAHERKFERAEVESKYTNRYILEMHWSLEYDWKTRTGTDLPQCMCGHPKLFCRDFKCMLELCGIAAGAMSTVDGAIAAFSLGQFAERDGVPDAT